MSGSLQIKAIFLIAILFYLSSSSGVNGNKKKICEKPKQTAYELDYDWVMGHSKWYFPMMSKEDLVRQAGDILKQPVEKIREDKEIASKACMKATWDGLSPMIRGFDGKRTSYNLSPTDWTNFNILAFDKAWDKGQAGTLYITHSDNKNFVFFVRCWDDGERTWNVMTTTEKPRPEIKKEILDHVKLLDFPLDDVEYIDYDNCKKKGGKTEL